MCLLPPLHSLHAVREKMRGRWETYRIRSNTFLGYCLPLAFFFPVCFPLFIIARPSGTFYELCPNSADFLNVQLVLLPAPEKTAQEGSFPRSLKCNVWGALSMDGSVHRMKRSTSLLVPVGEEKEKKKKTILQGVSLYRYLCLPVRVWPIQRCYWHSLSTAVLPPYSNGDLHQSHKVALSVG